MSSSQVYIVRDDAGGRDMIRGPLEWSTANTTQTFGGIQTWPDFSVDIVNPDPNLPAGFMKFSFDGTSVAIWGTTAQTSQDFKVSIDDEAIYDTNTGDTSPQNYLQWYQSPVLAEGTHSVNVSGIRATAVDLFLITPGPATSLQGQTLLVDDASNAIKYTGNGWKAISDRKFGRSANVKAQPLLNGTHQTTTAGDGLRFAFTGTRTQVIGMLLNSGSGNPLSLSYSIDDGPPSNRSLTYQQPVVAGQATSNIDQLNVQLLDTGDLPAGPHTIDLKVVESTSQPLIVDYILYQPSFSSLSTMPDLSALSVPPGSTASKAAPTPSNSTGASTGNSSRRGTPAGAIAGGVLGGLVALFLICGFLFWRHRRRKAAASSKSIEDGIPDPFVTPPKRPIRPPRPTKSLIWSRPTKSMMISSPVLTQSSNTLSYMSDVKLPFVLPEPQPQMAPPLPDTPPPLPAKHRLIIPERPAVTLPSETSPSVYSMASAPRGTMTVRRDEIQRRLRELQMLVNQSQAQEETGNSSPSSIVSPGGSRHEDTDDLRRRIERLEEENARLAMLSEPPPY